MDRFLVVTFDSVLSARSALRSLAALDREGAIASYVAMVVSNRDGIFERDAEPEAPNHSRIGAALNRFLSAVEGNRRDPEALEAEWVDVDVDFIGEVYSMLTIGRAAIVANIDEDRVTPLDTKMEALQGHVFRRARTVSTDAQLRERLSSLDAELARLDIEHANATAERRAKLEAAVRAMLDRRRRLIEANRARQLVLREEAAEKVALLVQKVADGGEAAQRHRERIALLARAFDVTI
jgi:hypothetical protein